MTSKRRNKLVISRLTKKSQATVPLAVRQALNLQPGDSVVFELEGERVTLKKVSPVDWDYLQAVTSTLSEWNSDADAAAYRDL